MKKLFYLVLVAFTTMFVGCDKENNTNEGDNNGSSVVGTWNLHHDDDHATLVLNEDNSFSLLKTNLWKEEGSYTYENKTLTLTTSRAWERDYVRDEINGGPVFDENGNFQYTEWQEANPQESVKSGEVKMIYNGDVMLYKEIEDHGEPYEVWAPYVKENATHVSNVNDIQGKWYWLMGEESTVPRVIVTVTGNNGDVIIAPWGERYTGTIRYEKGVIYIDNPTFTTTRYLDENGEWEHINEVDPENSDWRTPFGENPYCPTFVKVSLGFVVDGNNAYGGIANLLAVFVKQ